MLWSTLCEFVIGALKSDIELNSLYRFQRHFMSLVFVLMGFVILLTVNINLHTECIKFTSISANPRVFLKEGWPIQETKMMLKPLNYNIFALSLMVVCFLYSYMDYTFYKLFSRNKLKILLDSIDRLRNVKRDRKFVLTYSRIKRDSFVWAHGFIISEYVAFMLPIFQFYYINFLLDGHYWLLGTQNWEDRQEMFPIILISSTSESNQSHDLLCMLPINKLFEVMFFCIWWWLKISIPLSVLGFAWLRITFSCFRLSSMNQFLWSNSGPPLSTLSQVSKSRLKKMSTIIPFTEWLYIFHICNNLDKNSISILLRNCCQELNLEDNSENVVDSTSEDDSHQDDEEISD